MRDVSGQITIDALQDFADDWNRHDIDALIAFMTEDCVFEASAGSANAAAEVTGI